MGTILFEFSLQFYWPHKGQLISKGYFGVFKSTKKSNVLPDDPENDKTGFEDATADLTKSVKGQLISKYPFGVFKSTKIPTKFL